MSPYDTILQELDRRIAALVQKHAGRLTDQGIWQRFAGKWASSMEWCFSGRKSGSPVGTIAY
jgi:hypothetical protein